jgi:hypothetical protein
MYTSRSSTFIESLTSVNFSFLQMFGHLLGPKSFDNLEVLLNHKQASLPIIFNGTRLISITTITPITYLGSWAFITLIIVARFMVNQHLFLLEALT